MQPLKPNTVYTYRRRSWSGKLTKFHLIQSNAGGMTLPPLTLCNQTRTAENAWCKVEELDRPFDDVDDCRSCAKVLLERVDAT